jgi:hypothetical protein
MREDELRWGRRRLWHIQGCSAVSGDGLYEGLDWLVAALKNPGAPTVATHEANPGRCLLRPSCSEPVPSEALKSASEQEADRLQALLLEWLSRPDLPEDEFLQHLDAATLEMWDHYSNLRTAWLYLTRLGRREGIKRIFAVIRSFLERSPLTRPSDVLIYIYIYICICICIYIYIYIYIPHTTMCVSSYYYRCVLIL